MCCDVAVNELILKHRQRMKEQKKIKVEHLVGVDMTRGDSVMCEIFKITTVYHGCSQADCFRDRPSFYINIT